MCSSTRGPATAPSLVTCPTRNTGVREPLAKCSIASPHSRTCVTVPGPPSRSARESVWIESTTIASGAIWAAASSTTSRSVSHSSSSDSGTAPRREARRRICVSLSSPVTYRMRWPSRASAMASCSSSVLLPMPGSPPTSSSEPGTSPPPSTRSSSRMPVRVRSADSTSTCASGRAPSPRTAPAGTQRLAPRGAASRTARGRRGFGRGVPSRRSAGSARTSAAARCRRPCSRRSSWRSWRVSPGESSGSPEGACRGRRRGRCGARRCSGSRTSSGASSCPRSGPGATSASRATRRRAGGR